MRETVSLDPLCARTRFVLVDSTYGNGSSEKSQHAA